MFEGVTNILVIKLRHIGDVLLTVPAIRALKKTFPGARVSALVNSGTEDMLTLNPLIHEVITLKRSKKGPDDAGRLKREMKFVGDLRKRKFDLTVDLTGGDRAALLGFLSGAKYRLGYVPKRGFAGKRLLYTHLAERPEVRTHTVLRDLGLVRSFGIDTNDLTVDIYATAADEEDTLGAMREAGYKGGPFVHVHPTSRWLFKCWRDESMAYVLDMIEEAGFRAVITSGPDEKERERVESIVSLMRKTPVNLSGKITLKGLVCLSRRAGFFFGVDTAPMHIAAAAGARVVSIFGPSGAFDWGPWDNDEAKRFRAGKDSNTPYPGKCGVQTFGRNTVIQVDWDCAPCGKDGCNGSKISDCLEKLEPEKVWKIVKKEIDRGRAL